MRTRFTWIVAILVLVSVALLIACSTTYTASYNGLVVVPSQAQVVMQSFSLDLGNGHVGQITNLNGPPTRGLPSSVILDPAGAFAYLIVSQNPGVADSVTGIETFSIASDGKLAPIKTTALNKTDTNVPVVPVALTMDSTGKFLFVADSATSDGAGNLVAGSVSVLAIGGNASLKEVAGSPFTLPVPLGGQTPSASALAVTPTVYPKVYAVCSVSPAPTTENLYVTDSVNYILLNYSVNPSTGVLTLVPYLTAQPGAPTGTVPSGVAVDPCNRFVYVANASPDNSVSAFTICSVVLLPKCQYANYSLLPVPGSPYSLSPGDDPGPMAVDAYGNYLYVVDTGEGIISPFRISETTGSLTPLTPPIVTANPGANSIAIRSDDSWMFVANRNTATVSQYGIIPSTGALVVQPLIDTFNYPSGVAVH
ncbi:MAG: beta-propeller fold lactonase family protein [Candidatus Sulfotelmatobacter sp.]